MTENECIEWVAKLEFAGCDTNDDGIITRHELADALRLELGRDPIETELEVSNTRTLQ